ncbi:hypothetical protein [Methylomicrobium lacus]|uniref:hypothetical protein n=1 Tax=Methylomicrobium lacus TaxID=136992 RepID=UPI0035A8FB4F
MNTAQIKCLLVFSVFAIIGFGPVSPGCLIGMYIVIARPQWFITFAQDLYDNPHPPHFQERLGTDSEKQTRQTRLKCFLSLLGLFIIDIAPIPTTPIIAAFIIFIRPAWFIRTIANVYGKDLKA